MPPTTEMNRHYAAAIVSFPAHVTNGVTIGNCEDLYVFVDFSAPPRPIICRRSQTPPGRG